MWAESSTEACEPLQVVLPSDLSRFFVESGYAPSTNNEHRAVARLRVRREVVFSFTHTPKMVRRLVERQPQDTHRGLLKDLSRTGMGLLYHEQLYPGESISMEFEQRLFEIEVVRCRRLDTACYEIGGVVKAVTSLQQKSDE